MKIVKKNLLMKKNVKCSDGFSAQTLGVLENRGLMPHVTGRFADISLCLLYFGFSGEVTRWQSDSALPAAVTQAASGCVEEHSTAGVRGFRCVHQSFLGRGRIQERQKDHSTNYAPTYPV